MADNQTIESNDDKSSITRQIIISDRGTKIYDVEFKILRSNQRQFVEPELNRIIRSIKLAIKINRKKLRLDAAKVAFNTVNTVNAVKV